jgi:hypothetical protein
MTKPIKPELVQWLEEQGIFKFSLNDLEKLKEQFEKEQAEYSSTTKTAVPLRRGSS